MANILKCLFLVKIVFGINSISAQTGLISSRVLDNGEPLIGANVFIKGTTVGTITDFDGAYEIECSLGDVLVISYVGYANREILITSDTFNNQIASSIVIKKEAVKPINSSDFINALSENDNIQTASPLLNVLNCYNRYLHNIKKIDVLDDKLNIVNKKPPWNYSIGYLTNLRLTKLPKRRLPKLQSTFAQGRPIDGQLRWNGPETGEIFSFGPSLSSLSFDGSDYLYDPNGKLNTDQTISGIAPYENDIFNTAYRQSHKLNAEFVKKSNRIKLNWNHTFDEMWLGEAANKINAIALDIKNDKNNYSYWNDNEFNYHINTKFAKGDFNSSNINGLFNEVYRQALITPSTFNNELTIIDKDGRQSSFSPINFDHPRGLLDHSEASRSFEEFLISGKGQISFLNQIELELLGSYVRSQSNVAFGLESRNLNRPEGFDTDKLIVGESVNIGYAFTKKFKSLVLKQELSSSIENGKYDLVNNLINKPDLERDENRFFERDRNTTKLSTQAQFIIGDFNQFDFQINHSAYVSSIQNNQWFLPSLSLRWDLDKSISILESKNLASAIFNLSYSHTVVESPLIFEGSNHASLLQDPSRSYFVNDNLEIPLDGVDLESHRILNIDQNVRYLFGKKTLDIGIGYKRTWIANSVFPIAENNIFALKNVADISSHTWSGKIDFEYYGTKGSFFQSRLTFNKYNSKVNRLHSSKSSIPLSGFNSINQSLLLDQPAGVILGTSYLRNSDGQLIIDDQGFPKVNLQKSVIGDPTPSVSLSLYQLIKYKRFSFSMLFNAQIGGDYWSGTQQALNYFGRSLESADLRAVNNYVFPGVRADGSINSIPVAFASSESTVFDNRWTRYGYLGVGEEGIKDASYFNIASVRLSYQVYNRSQIFREWRFGVFGKNVLLLNHVSGYNYQSSLFGINTLSAIDYFNLPLPVEIGLFVEVKI